MIDKVYARIVAIRVLVQVERELVVRAQIVVAGAIGRRRSTRVAGRLALVAFGADDALCVAVAAAITRVAQISLARTIAHLTHAIVLGVAEVALLALRTVLAFRVVQAWAANGHTI